MKKNYRSGYTVIEVLTTLVIVFVILAIFLSAVARTGLGGTVSNGKRAGVLTKFSNKGFFVKSYEGELVMGGTRQSNTENGSNLMANVWEFSCSDPKVAEELDKLLLKEVIITYRQSFVVFARDTSYDVISVEEVKK